MNPQFFSGGFLLPHPPVIVPAVGQGREQEAHATLQAMDTAAALFADWKPETVILISPHAPVFRDFVFFYEPTSGDDQLRGSLRDFGDTQEHAWPWDGPLQQRILSALQKHGIPAGTLDAAARKRYDLKSTLDHGALVPLHFLTQSGHPFHLIVLASSGIDAQQLFELGGILRDEAEAMGRKTVVVASGDLSHKVNRQSPYGSVPEGAKFDHLLMDLLAKGDLAGAVSIEHALREKAAECGFRSLLILCGALSGLQPEVHVHAYEAPFGIGYGVVSFRVPRTAQTDARAGEDTSGTEQARQPLQMLTPVRLARLTLEKHLQEGYHLSLPEAGAPDFLRNTRAGAFVSLHKFGELRGCIGTIVPTTGSLAEEIIQNAISAATGDPRFDPVTAEELPYLTIHVDVLNPPEPVLDKSALDPKIYGVIVEKGMHRGLLLPDLEGVDTVEEQLNIACRKGGIDPNGSFRMERFTVTRYSGESS